MVWFLLDDKPDFAQKWFLFEIGFIIGEAE
jgi:hypothetical protein